MHVTPLVVLSRYNFFALGGSALSPRPLRLLTSCVQLTPRVFDGHASSASDSAGEGSSLVNRIDYSDLASILMDGGFDACKVWRVVGNLVCLS